MSEDKKKVFVEYYLGNIEKDELMKLLSIDNEEELNKLFNLYDVAVGANRNK